MEKISQIDEPDSDHSAEVAVSSESHKTLLTGLSSLQAMLKIVSKISLAVDINEVLMRFLHKLTELTESRGGTIRLRGEDDLMYLVSSVGMDDDIVYRDRVIPESACICGNIKNDGQVIFQEDLGDCSAVLNRDFFYEGSQGNRNLSMIVGSLTFQGKSLGIFNLYIDQDKLDRYRQYEELFCSLGEYVGLAIEKKGFAEEVEQMSIVEERTRMANELHDSLAQTMASVRFQVRVLDDTLHQGHEESLWSNLEKIENSLDEANEELRELIAHFRAPMDEQGVISGVTRAVERFRRYSDIPIFFQRDWPDTRLPAEYELQIVRIVQESLANIRKHSHAKIVRVLMRGNKKGKYRVLIEDDGIGLRKGLRSPGGSGEHIGLSIMKDRAKRIHGNLVIESEPGEGTRVLLKFNSLQADSFEKRG